MAALDLDMLEATRTWYIRLSSMQGHVWRGRMDCLWGWPNECAASAPQKIAVICGATKKYNAANSGTCC